MSVTAYGREMIEKTKQVRFAFGSFFFPVAIEGTRRSRLAAYARSGSARQVQHRKRVQARRDHHLRRHGLGHGSLRHLCVQSGSLVERDPNVQVPKRRNT